MDKCNCSLPTQVCDTPGRKGRAPQKSKHVEIMLEQEMLKGKNAHKAKFRVNLNHWDFPESGWLRQGRAGSSRGKQPQPRHRLQQSWHRARREKAAGVVVRTGGHREIWGKNIMASFLGERFAQKTLGTTALGAVLLKIEQVLFQQIWIH